MSDEDSVLDANNVRHNPVCRLAVARVSAVEDDKISLRHNGSWFVLEGARSAPDQIKQAIATGHDMSAVLDIVRRPETRSGCP